MNDLVPRTVFVPDTESVTEIVTVPGPAVPSVLIWQDATLSVPVSVKTDERTVPAAAVPLLLQRTRPEPVISAVTVCRLLAAEPLPLTKTTAT